MPAPGKEVHLGRNACVVQGTRVHGALADPVDRVVPSLKQECRRRLFCDAEAGIEGPRLLILATAKMTGIESDREVRTAAHLVGGVDRFVGRLEYVTGLSNQVSAGGESNDTDLVRIDIELLSTRANEPDRSLRILEGARDLRRDVGV